jgi:hypothetical protein
MRLLGLLAACIWGEIWIIAYGILRKQYLAMQLFFESFFGDGVFWERGFF